MAHPALKRFSYFGQFGILAGFVGAGLVLAFVANIIPILLTPGASDIFGDGKGNLMDKLFVPENAGMLRWVQFLGTIFLFSCLRLYTQKFAIRGHLNISDIVIL